MSRDISVIALRQPEAIDDPLTELAREGARRILAQVLIAEADAFVALWKDVKLPDGRDRVVRHGHGPHGAIQTGIGPVEVRRAKVRDRGDVGPRRRKSASARVDSCRRWGGDADEEPRRAVFANLSTCAGCQPVTSRRRLLPCWARSAPNLSSAVISRLTAAWQAVYDAWQKRDLSARTIRGTCGRTGSPTCRLGWKTPCRMHAGADRRRDAEGKKDTRRLPDRGARERAELWR